MPEPKKLEERPEQVPTKEPLAPSLRPPPKVQVLLDHGWTDFSEQDCKQVQNNVENGTFKFAMNLHGAMYIIEIDGKHGTQTNAATKKARELRITEPTEKVASAVRCANQKARG